ncbi:MAG TPA: hypothetical protein VI935_09575 [Thermodesulfobacteriota bacterium]|nr:hypothetical protein [Thermodesulfobacteriota bacterium]
METDRDEQLKTRIDWLRRISTHTVVSMKVLKVVEDERQRIAELVASHREKDGAKVSMASSPFYGLTRQITSFSQAV